MTGYPRRIAVVLAVLAMVLAGIGCVQAQPQAQGSHACQTDLGNGSGHDYFACVTENIRDYHADIDIAADSSMSVVEDIKVNALHQQMTHGIYRDFPTVYPSAFGPVHVGFKMLRATLDGSDVPWRVEMRDNGVRIYLGDPAQTLPVGVHDYTIAYETHHEVGFFADHDELYWNVNGTGWTVPAYHVSATIHLPVPVPASELSATAYTGTHGSRSHDARITLSDGAGTFTTTHGLWAHESLTAVLSFPKGVVHPPSLARKALWALLDNRGVARGCMGLAVVWLYYLVAWWFFGRDPMRGRLVARSEPPFGYSAAVLRYVWRMGWDKDCLTAGILGIAAKGGLAIDQWQPGTYTLRRIGEHRIEALTEDEHKLRIALFLEGEILPFERSEYERIQSILTGQKLRLEAICDKKFFQINSGWMWPGLGVSTATAWLVLKDVMQIKYLVVVLCLFAVVAIKYIVPAVLQGNNGLDVLWRRLKNHRYRWLILAACIPLGLVFVALLRAPGLGTSFVLIALVATNLAFQQWLKAPSLAGAKLRDRIRGFRWYLGGREKQELSARFRHKAAPEQFDEFLPYAFALDLDDAWSQWFSKALAAVPRPRSDSGWDHAFGNRHYVGGHRSTFSDMHQGLSSGLSNAIASSSVAPGSSSGMGGFGGSGGGSSGGGGGGGGGGGW